MYLYSIQRSPPAPLYQSSAVPLLYGFDIFSGFSPAQFAQGGLLYLHLPPATLQFPKAHEQVTQSPCRTAVFTWSAPQI